MCNECQSEDCRKWKPETPALILKAMLVFPENQETSALGSHREGSEHARMPV
jgi:hypothetical protein